MPPLPRPSRRDFIATLALSAIGGAVGCSSSLGGVSVSKDSARLEARPGTPSNTIQPGEHELALGAARNGILYVPESYRPEQPAPLLVLLHGAGGSAQNWFGSYGGRAESLGIVVLAPESRGPTWDVVQGTFERDAPFIDAALRYTFDRCAIDGARIAIGGFSDGASYALSLGIPNGDLFTHVIAYSPGFILETTPNGRPAFFISHGINDQVLSIAATSRVIVPALRGRGYAVEYTEFDGGHEVPPAISTQALDWALRA